MRVIKKASSDSSVVGGIPLTTNPFFISARKRLQKSVSSLQRLTTRKQRSLGWPNTGLAREINQLPEIDIFNLHSLVDNTLSIKEISQLNKPIIWTMHDMWAFCGTEHYLDLETSWEDKSEIPRYQQGYTHDNRPTGESGFDLSLYSWKRKMKYLSNRNLHIVCPSEWMRESACSSILARNWPVHKIPYPIDTDRWSPLDKVECRRRIGLSLDKKIILYGASGGTSNPRKGFDLLVSAIEKILVMNADLGLPDFEVVVFGQATPDQSTSPHLPIRYIGHLSNETDLVAAYSAADIYALTSRQDNLPNTGIEAHACGTPVVGFRTTGINDIVDHNSTGYLASPFDTVELAHAIIALLSNDKMLRVSAHNARNKALETWSENRVALKYLTLYHQVCEK
jgi:glycosyltransferase involved in cell wall biosynthesis